METIGWKDEFDVRVSDRQIFVTLYNLVDTRGAKQVAYV